MALTVRRARAADEVALAALDRATWSWNASPAPRPRPGAPFFRPGGDPGDVLVAEADGRLLGYVQLGHPTALRSNRHVVELQGLAVDRASRRRGVGRALLGAAIEEAAARGARRIRLRVLAPNAEARALYASAGFAVDGVLREEFRLDGRYVDDVLMGLDVMSRERS